LDALKTEGFQVIKTHIEAVLKDQQTKIQKMATPINGNEGNALLAQLKKDNEELQRTLREFIARGTQPMNPMQSSFRQSTQSNKNDYNPVPSGPTGAPVPLVGGDGVPYAGYS
jgi:hypothetical protein